MVSKGAKQLTVLVPLLLASVSCSQRVPDRELERPQEERKYVFRLQPDRVKDLVVKVNTLKDGDDLNLVIDKLGTPTYNQPMARKERDAKMQFRIVRYYTQILNTLPVYDDRFDRYIELRFDSRDKLVRIRSNVDGVKVF